MSVDDRVRTALEDGARAFDPDPARTLGVVVATARRRRSTRRLAVAGLVVVALVGTGIGLGLDRGAPSTAPAAPVPTMNGIQRLEADARLTTALAGTWTTAVVTPAQATAALARTGNEAHRAVVLDDIRVPGRFSLVLDGRTFRTTLGDEQIDVGTWLVKDGRLEMTPSCGFCHGVFVPRLDGDALHLTIVEVTSPDYKGVPDAAFASVAYTAAPFIRRP